MIAMIPLLALGYSSSFVRAARNSPSAPQHPQAESYSHDSANENAQYREYRDYDNQIWRRAATAFFSIQVVGLILAGFAFWLLPRDGTATGDKTILALTPLLNVAVTFAAYIGWAFREG
ncbi:hypothetical protein [Lacipirellula sp.]|uniref:hypothetical protein n=1 Tax=Lacipirellula sp. TaxID=2691419 RepID=UPI003D0C567B